MTFDDQKSLAFFQIWQQSVPVFPPFASVSEFFTELLAHSKRDFHFMFKKTYGILYERNSDVFTDFFKDLESYYENGNVDLEEALRKFFSHLYQRMFTVLNSQYSFDSK